MGHVSLTGERKDAFGISIEQRKGQKQLGRFMGSWKGNSKMLIKEIWWQSGRHLFSGLL
jgi:hypothetical protein